MGSQGNAVRLVKTVGDGASSASQKRVRKTVRVPKLHEAEKRTIGQFIAAVAAAFLPVASYVLSHFEAKTQPMMWGLVVAALMFSAPTLVEWAERWCKSKSKAVGFAALLEGVMVLSATTWLGVAGLVLLMVINCHAAWQLAGKSMQTRSRRKE